MSDSNIGWIILIIIIIIFIIWLYRTVTLKKFVNKIKNIPKKISNALKKWYYKRPIIKLYKDIFFNKPTK